MEYLEDKGRALELDLIFLGKSLQRVEGRFDVLKVAEEMRFSVLY